MKKTVYISGRMGNQLLRYFIALADSMENDYEIEAVVVTLHPNFLTEMLDLKVRAVSQLKARQSDIHHNVEKNIRMLFKHRGRLLEEGWIKLKMVENFINAETCIHLRGGDKKSAPLQWYCNKAKGASGKVCVCTDDIKYGKAFMVRLAEMGMKDIVFASQNYSKDWHTILGAGEIYCSVSTFPLSVLLFDPNKRMIVCSRRSSTRDFRIDGSREGEFQFVKTAMDYCPNLEFED